MATPPHTNPKSRPPNLHGFLRGLSDDEVQKLYESDVWSCQAAFRSLPPLSKQLILRLLFVEPIENGSGSSRSQAQRLFPLQTIHSWSRIGTPGRPGWSQPIEQVMIL
jgi:hypothetical protein